MILFLLASYEYLALGIKKVLFLTGRDPIFKDLCLPNGLPPECKLIVELLHYR